MPEPANIPVPIGTLRLILAQCRAGISPLIHWSESRPNMDHAAMQKRREALEEIEAEVEALLPKEP